MKGIYVSLNEGDLASYRVTLDANGREMSREVLRPAGGGQVRVAPPPPAADPSGAGSRGGSGRGGAGRRGGATGAGPAFPQMPAGIPSPIARPISGLREGDWNTIDLILDANILRAFPNDAGGVSGGVADEEFASFGAIALYAGGTGEVRSRTSPTRICSRGSRLPSKCRGDSGCRR